MMLLSSGSGVAQPLSPPATDCQALLGVAVHVVGNLIVDSDVVNLSDGKLDMFPGSAASNRYRHSTVICYSHPIGIDWVDPDVVIVSARRACKWGYLGCLAAIQRHRERSCQVIGFIFIVRRDCHPKVIVSAAAHVAVITDNPPVLTAVVGAPKLAAVRLLALDRDAVAGLDHGVHSIRICPR